jgi:hypothetical protein
MNAEIFVMLLMIPLYAGGQMSQQEVTICARDWACSQTMHFDWREYDVLVPYLESIKVKPGFWKNWRRSTNVEIALQGRYRP